MGAPSFLENKGYRGLKKAHRDSQTPTKKPPRGRLLSITHIFPFIDNAPRWEVEESEFQRFEAPLLRIYHF